MADQPDATLRDVTQPNPPAPAAKPAEPAATPAPDAAAAAKAVADAEAAEVGRILLDSGFSKAQLNELMAAPQALKSIQHLVRENPQEFLTLLERTDPDAAVKFHNTMADLYIQRYGSSNDGKQPDGKNGKGEVAPEVMNEVAALREEVGQYRTEREQERNRVALAAIESRYNARVDELFSALPKEAGLNKAETKALRAQLSSELAGDRDAIQRINNGNFVDVPSRFKSIVDGFFTERKSASEAAKAARDRSTSGASPEFLGGPGVISQDALTAALGNDDWGEGFAKVLESSAR